MAQKNIQGDLNVNGEILQNGIGITDAYDSDLGDSYNPNSTYAVGDVVVFEHLLYKCLVAVTEPEPFDESKWETVTVKESLYGKFASYSDQTSSAIVTLDSTAWSALKDDHASFDVLGMAMPTYDNVDYKIVLDGTDYVVRMSLNGSDDAKGAFMAQESVTSGSYKTTTFYEIMAFMSKLNSVNTQLVLRCATIGTETREVGTVTIPYVGTSTLTASYVQQVAESLGQDAIDATKVIVPVEFTEYESGSIQAIIDAFDNMTTLTTTYEAGVIDLNFLDPIIQSVMDRISAIGKTLDEALVYARKWSITNPRPGVGSVGYNDSNLVIVPPVDWSIYVPGSVAQVFRYSNNIVYFADFVGYSSTLDFSYEGGAFTSNNVVYFGAINLENADGFRILLFSKTYLEYTGGYNIQKNITISGSAMGHDAIVELLNNLLNVTNIGARTLTMGPTKLGLLSQAEKDIAINKGWTLA